MKWRDEWLQDVLAWLVACLLSLVALGCASYKAAGWTPDSANYTISVDQQTKDLTHYFGVGWNLKP